MSQDDRIRLPDGRVADATGWRADMEPVPNRPGRVSLLVSRPQDGDPVRYRIIRADDQDGESFQASAAESLADRIAAGRIDDIVRIRAAGRPGRPRTASGLRLETLDDRDGIIRIPALRITDRIRHRREQPAGVRPERRDPSRAERRNIRRVIRQTRRGR